MYFTQKGGAAIFMRFKKIVKKIKNIKNDVRGLSSLEATIGILIAIVLFAAYLDFIVISNKMQALSTTNTYLSRVISNQGCVAQNPSSCITSDTHEGGYNVDYIKNKTFVKSSEIYNQVDRIMKSESIPSSDWSVTIDGVPLTSNTTTRLFRFREIINIKIEVRYRWNNLSGFLPINLPEQKFTSNQRIVSTYQLRNQGSDIGFDYAG